MLLFRYNNNNNNTSQYDPTYAGSYQKYYFLYNLIYPKSAKVSIKFYTMWSQNCDGLRSQNSIVTEFRHNFGQWRTFVTGLQQNPSQFVTDFVTILKKNLSLCTSSQLCDGIFRHNSNFSAVISVTIFCDGKNLSELSVTKIPSQLTHFSVTIRHFFRSGMRFAQVKVGRETMNRCLSWQLAIGSGCN